MFQQVQQSIKERTVAKIKDTLFAVFRLFQNRHSTASFFHHEEGENLIIFNNKILN